MAEQNVKERYEQAVNKYKKKFSIIPKLLEPWATTDEEIELVLPLYEKALKKGRPIPMDDIEDFYFDVCNLYRDRYIEAFGKKPPTSLLLGFEHDKFYAKICREYLKKGYPMSGKERDAYFNYQPGVKY